MMCTQVDGHCSRDGKRLWIFELIGMFIRSPRIGFRMGIAVRFLLINCLSLRASGGLTFVCGCISFFTGTGPDFFDCRWDEHGDGNCYQLSRIM